MKLQSVDHISYAVTDIDKVIEAWSRLYGIGPWTFKENGGTDVKGRPWKIRMAFAYLGPVEIELVQCTEVKFFSPNLSINGVRVSITSVFLSMTSMPKWPHW